MLKLAYWERCRVIRVKKINESEYLIRILIKNKTCKWSYLKQNGWINSKQIGNYWKKEKKFIKKESQYKMSNRMLEKTVLLNFMIILKSQRILENKRSYKNIIRLKLLINLENFIITLINQLE